MSKSLQQQTGKNRKRPEKFRIAQGSKGSISSKALHKLLPLNHSPTHKPYDMHKILPALAFVITSLTASAQVTISPVGGFNFSGGIVKLDRDDAYHQGLTVLMPAVGALVDVPLSGKFGLQSGVLWVDDFSSIRASTLDVPVKLTYSYIIRNGSKIFVGAGPYVTVNIDPHATSDFGGGVNVGFRGAKGLLFCLQGQYGFTNLASDPFVVHGYKFGALGGYSFKLKKHKAHAEPPVNPR